MITTIPYTGNCMSGNGTIAIAVAAKALREQMIPARLGSEETVGVDAAKCESKTADIGRILVVTPSEGGQCVAMVLGRIKS
jgi:3-oxoacyl-(acyl-carrier-protein) synthase